MATELEPGTEKSKSPDSQLLRFRRLANLALSLGLGGFGLAMCIGIAEVEVLEPLKWFGLCLAFIGLASLPFIQWRLTYARGLTKAERKKALARYIWGGPIGIYITIWELTDRSGKSHVQ
jgi:hypothetical protein